MEALLGLPLNASLHGGKIDDIIIIMHLFMLGGLIPWGLFFFYTLFRFHKSKNPKADYVGVKNHLSSYLEVGVAIFEIVILVGLSIPFWVKHIDALPPFPQNATQVRVIAEQFVWNIHYPGRDGIFGKTAPEFVNTQSNPVGLDKSDPHAADDITTINQLHLPVNKPAIMRLSSKDVIHSFALPIMRVKQDVIPGMSIPTWFTPIKTGKSEIACAQLCGLGHYRMKGFLTIHTNKDFQAWLDEEHEALQGGEEDDFWG